MLREINKKQIILENRKPYKSGVAEYIQEINMIDWITSSLRLTGSTLSRNDIQKILKGEFIANASLAAHADIERYRDLINTVSDMLAMSYTFSKDMVNIFQKKLTGKNSVTYRKDNPVLVSLGYNPPHPADIEEQIDLLMNWFYTEDKENDIIRKAATLHHRIIEIYPFDVYSEDVARASMYYYLMEKGYPAFELSYSEQEYNTAIIEYLKKGDAGPFCSGIERSLYNKMELLIRLTAE